MKLLLDTHIFLWLNSEPEKIPPAAYDACCDPHNQLYLSHVSPWEIQIKQQLGKLQLRAALPELIEMQARENGLNMLPIELSHIYDLSQLPCHHNDPFDRLLIAQARIESMVLVTVDRKISLYDVEVLSS
ncbi:type II toxin-antitoxin system VapC family toxin [Candidatus Electronema sp. PJ]|uniref:type II toxin-antitoxin system VapC family toxin n=1 Tax=Candidatus Electronema sp. PJ TaxID=3401572 RepID=UPI003AA88BC3